MSGGDDIDPGAWIKWVGIPMKTDVEGLKRSFWWATGSAVGISTTLGLLAPYILRKLGLV